MRVVCILILALFAPACADELRHADSPAEAAHGAGADHDDHDDDHDDDHLVSTGGDLTSQEARVLVLQTTRLDRPAEVIGVVDAHESMGRHDAALATLKRRAAALGADAVVGVEFHHGEGQGEPTHLSGLAVHFLSRFPFASR